MKSIQEKTILVTGATDGIGKIAASRLAQMGPAVLLHGRDPQKCQTVKDEIVNTSGNRRLECLTADFSSLAEVRQMAAAIRDGHVDVLINNAGVLPAESQSGQRRYSKDGHDLCMAVNYLAPFLLTHLLLPLLRAAEAARIVNVSSAAQEPINFTDLMLEKYYSPMKAYSRSKLALAMFTFELDQRLKAEKITVNCLHPGSLLDTKMVRQTFGRPWGSAESGADVEVYVATAPELDGVSGVYFNRKNRSQAQSQAYDQQTRQKLWQISLELTGLAARQNP